MQQWVKSSRLMHMMRDNPSHDTLVMGGMFGIYQPLSQIQRMEETRVQLFKPITTNDQIRLSVRPLQSKLNRQER